MRSSLATQLAGGNFCATSRAALAFALLLLVPVHARRASTQSSTHYLCCLPLLLVCSGDVGLGLNARRLRNNFLQRFNVTYSLRPVGEVGTVFRRFPELWKVFVEDKDLPGR